MNMFFGILLFLIVAAFRAVLWVMGWALCVPLSLVADGAKRTPAMWKMWADAVNTPAAYSTGRWKKYVWWAWRNPTPGLRERWTQPIDERLPNPDLLVREGTEDPASRFMQSGLYWEYWWMRSIRWTLFGKRYYYFEFRIGWKFVDGNDEFFPTLQFGPRSS